ncbi:hypothetical protein SNEBB_001921 [Seison nebaliae]|nr:hypothetical protein SNEBB_001921 [Seison nebaliae]
MEYIKTHKNEQSIASNGFIYHHKRDNKNATVAYGCSQQQVDNCKAILLVDIRSEIVKYRDCYSHERMDERIMKLKFYNKIREEAVGTNLKPREIVRKIIYPLEDCEATIMGSKKAMKRRICKLRQKNGEHLDDNSIDRKDFANGTILWNKEDVQQINDFNQIQWYMDGTFSVCQNEFAQLYILNVELEGGYIITPI